MRLREDEEGVGERIDEGVCGSISARAAQTARERGRGIAVEE
jgi:hypothetical protein